MDRRDWLAVALVGGYFGSMCFVWLIYLLGGSLEQPAVETIKAIAQYGSPFIGIVIGYYFPKGK